MAYVKGVAGVPLKGFGNSCKGSSGAGMRPSIRAQKVHINRRILPNSISGIPLILSLKLKPECEILVFMWSFRPLVCAGELFPS